MLSNKMSTLRSRKPVSIPTVHEVMAIIEEYTSGFEIMVKFDSISKLLHNDEDIIAAYWFNFPYSLEEENHRLLLTWLFSKIGLKHPAVITFLNGIDNPCLLSSLGLNRVNNNYRIRTGVFI